MPTSSLSILRRMMDLPDLPVGEIVELGIDDFAFRRGYRFGTILVNLVSHRVVDLLPDRDQERAAAWMKQHPEIRVVSRDRGSEYAAAVAKGAPQAVQVRDSLPCRKKPLRSRDDLEQEDLKAWLMASPPLARAYQLVQDFLMMVHKREGHRLAAWLQQVEVSSIPELQSFARCGWNGIKLLSRLG